MGLKGGKAMMNFLYAGFPRGPYFLEKYLLLIMGP